MRWRCSFIHEQYSCDNSLSSPLDGRRRVICWELIQSPGMESDAEAFLRAFPRPATRVRPPRRWRRTHPRGLSSYDLLRGSSADAGPGHRRRPRLRRRLSPEQVRARDLPNARLIGIDMSPEELAAARRRLGSGVELLLERAQAALPDRSVDYPPLHMALMRWTTSRRWCGRSAGPHAGGCAAPWSAATCRPRGPTPTSRHPSRLAGAARRPAARPGDRAPSRRGARRLFARPVRGAGRGRGGRPPLGRTGRHVWHFLSSTYWSALLSAEEWQGSTGSHGPPRRHSRTMGRSPAHSGCGSARRGRSKASVSPRSLDRKIC